MLLRRSGFCKFWVGRVCCRFQRVRDDRPLANAVSVFQRLEQTRKEGLGQVLGSLLTCDCMLVGWKCTLAGGTGRSDHHQHEEAEA